MPTGKRWNMTWVTAAAVGVALACAGRTRGAPTILAENGQARFPVIVAENAPAETRIQAGALAAYLGRISGATFVVTNGSGRTGIAVGTLTDFPELSGQIGEPFDPADPFRRDEYLLRSHPRGLLLLGSTPTAAGHAVWDCLHRLGCRWFFPFENWECIPEQTRPAIGVDLFESPDFIYRNISGIGYEEDWATPYREWALRNRLRSGFDLKLYHVYQQIIAEYKSEFEAHPEYYGLVNGQRTSHKLCPSNPGLRDLAVRFSTNYLARRPGESCVSMEPSDGAGWCECAACVAIGSPSDRAIFLANHVARALRETHPQACVGLLAYHRHMAPPKLAVEPNVIVSLATRYGTGGLAWDEVVKGWRARAVHLGMYDYFSLWMSHHGLPGGGKATDSERLVGDLASAHADGIRFFNGESCDGWGATGLGHYLAARVLWDVDEASRREALIDDFLKTCFGAAIGPMRRFYELMDRRNAPLMSADLVGRLFRQLQEAHAAAGDARVAARIDDLTLYVRYLELYRDYRGAPIADGRKQAAYETLARYAYRTRRSGMINVKAWFVWPESGLSIALPSENPWRAWLKPEGVNPWKSGEAPTQDEIAVFRAEGLTRNPIIEHEPYVLDRALAPSGLPPAEAGTFGDRLGPHVLLLRASRGSLPAITLSTGHATTEYGGVRWRLKGPDGAVIVSGEVPPDKMDHVLDLSATGDGIHRLEYDDKGAGTRWLWADGAPVVAMADRHQPIYGIGQRQLYFFVPKGTQRIVAWVSSMASVTFRDPSGRTVTALLQSWPDRMAVEVPDGQDGQAWSVISNVNGQFALLNVPPYLARSPDELLVPVASPAGRE